MTQGVMGVDEAYTSAPWSECPDPSDAAVALGIAINSPTFFVMLVKIVREVVSISRKKISATLESVKMIFWPERSMRLGLS